MNKTNKIARQGDILSVKTNKAIGKKVETKTIALGEVTGHHHSFGHLDNVVCYADDAEVKSFEVLADDATLTHQEHNPTTYEKNIYKVYREFVFDPFAKVLERARD